MNVVPLQRQGASLVAKATAATARATAPTTETRIMDEMMRTMAQSMGAQLGESMLGDMAQSRDNLRKMARDSKPANKIPAHRRRALLGGRHEFDADASHTFDELADYAETVGLGNAVDRQLYRCNRAWQADGSPGARAAMALGRPCYPCR